ncbi:MAG TPA: glycosyl hydrolase [Gemmatimonadales bacterium]|nr:glycosyl hydrolase [Gemmatimonadales bacterium]
MNPPTFDRPARMPMARALVAFGLVLLLAAPPAPAQGVSQRVAKGFAQGFDPALFRELTWRPIGPYRGGRTKAAVGVPGHPGLFYIGAVNGGVFKTTDFGRTWTPIFDDEPTGSIGAIAVAPSNPDVIYVGSGEGLQRPDLSTGDGIYKSTDAGRTWTHLGLRDGQQIPQIAVDPHNPDRLFVAVLGHPYGPNAERGIFRSTDGGKTFEKVLYKDENTGGIDIVMAPDDPNTLYAALWESRQAPWENGQWQGPGTGLYKTTDGGDHWTPIMRGLPTFKQGLGRIGIGIAPSLPGRLFLSVDEIHGNAVFRSDDAGASWRRMTTDQRINQRASDFAEVKVDPTNPDIVYTTTIVVWRSTDGGTTWHMLRGAPGGDDYHRIWIDPRDPRTILIASDQGAIITVNGGESWSSWYNQPTAQFYHVSTDNAWPYRVCGGQQESGSACVASRGDDGEITFRDWHPVGAEEYGYVAADPLDPDLVFGGRLTVYDRRTGQTRDVAPKPFRDSTYRELRTAPALFSPVNPRKLYFASNTVWETTDGGTHWREISPDLTRRDSTVPPSVGTYAHDSDAVARHPGVVYTLAPSYLRENILWAGSDDGLIHVTFDGGRHWKNVTPRQVRPWAKISLMDASHFDTLTAYAAVNTFRLDDLRPHIYRTRDGGGSWIEITAGIDSGAAVNVVREDPVRRGLLFAGSETQVWVSFDDGDHWQSLRGNMPATSIRDLVVKGADLVAGTHGRGFWILDDISPLRQLGAAALADPAHLFRPALATRVRLSTYTDTPLPPDEPTAPNPPAGAIIDYHLSGSASDMSLEIVDASGKPVRRYERGLNPDPNPRNLVNVPDYWVAPSPFLSAEPGLHRFVWDLRYPWPRADLEDFTYPISAVPGRTRPQPRGPFVLPGRYTVRLTVDGRTYTQPLVVRMDPRVKTPMDGLRRQLALSQRLVAGIERAAALSPDSAAGTAPSATVDTARVNKVRGELVELLESMQGADVAPTLQQERAARERLDYLDCVAASRSSCSATH